MTISRNYEYELWLLAIGAAQGDAEALRAEWDAAISADRAERGLGPEPDETEPESGSWLSQITPAMVARAGRRPTANTAHRTELLHGRPAPSTIDTGSAIDYAAFVERGFRR
jgi:hypothetical protein